MSSEKPNWTEDFDQMHTEIADRLAEFAVDTKFADLPKEVIEFAKCLTLKTVCSMVVGSSDPSGQKMAKIIRDWRLPDEVGVTGCSCSGKQRVPSDSQTES